MIHCYWDQLQVCPRMEKGIFKDNELVKWILLQCGTWWPNFFISVKNPHSSPYPLSLYSRILWKVSIHMLTVHLLPGGCFVGTADGSEDWNGFSPANLKACPSALCSFAVDGISKAAKASHVNQWRAVTAHLPSFTEAKAIGLVAHSLFISFHIVWEN